MYCPGLALSIQATDLSSSFQTVKPLQQSRTEENILPILFSPAVNPLNQTFTMTEDKVSQYYE